MGFVERLLCIDLKRGAQIQALRRTRQPLIEQHKIRHGGRDKLERLLHM